MQQWEKTSMTRDDFIEWLFDRFDTPESSQFKLKGEYMAVLPENCDFRRLKKLVETKWRTLYSIPYAYWFRPYIVPKKEQKRVVQDTVCPAILNARESRVWREANPKEFREAAQACFDVVEQIWGRRPGRKNV